ncbi:hypothetical protein GS399_14910 [Pedobacter sp. HMF7647]|uniref:Uncharacterized protein n=1 Tax=Hufsiella arboris TaxID=2695275 RepID=A0A7K1YCF3_9SPHI|nr:hypothetical protein [Hufsiella arboris]MXV52266.1 hypothetical protein [Hufsiella arboris]
MENLGTIIIALAIGLILGYYYGKRIKPVEPDATRIPDQIPATERQGFASRLPNIDRHRIDDQTARDMINRCISGLDELASWPSLQDLLHYGFYLDNNLVRTLVSESRSEELVFYFGIREPSEGTSERGEYSMVFFSATPEERAAYTSYNTFDVNSFNKLIAGKILLDGVPPPKSIEPKP